MDKYYSSLLNSTDLETIINAGYLEEKYNYELNPKDRNSKEIILLTTGSFSPMHMGHIEMMRVAKKAVEKKGTKLLIVFIHLVMTHMF